MDLQKEWSRDFLRRCLRGIVDPYPSRTRWKRGNSVTCATMLPQREPLRNRLAAGFKGVTPGEWRFPRGVEHIGVESGCDSHFQRDTIAHVCYTASMYEYTRQ
jgi:hypothetical protein